MATSENLKRVKTNPTYRSWWGMVRRCNDEDNEDYGGRGITYCARWEDYEAFVEDMGPRPTGHTLDRIDPDGDYCRENCRWSTPEAQANNRRTSRYLTHEGETLSVTQWARRVGLNDQTLFHRLRAGWGLGRALTTPAKKAA